MTTAMALRRALGFRFFERTRRGFELRLSWAEITGGFGLALALINWGEDRDWSLHIRLGWPNIYLKLPFLPRTPRSGDMMDQWGFSFFERAIHLHWGARTKIVHLPWEQTFIRSSVLASDGRTWFHDLASRPKPVAGAGGEFRFVSLRDVPRWQVTLPYRYVLRSGDVQNVEATISVEEREWRQRWLKWCPLGANVRRSIDVSFSGEVGERAGSWKGGCTGCGYELRPDETPEECLRRMETERAFR